MAKVNLWLRGARGKFAGASLAKGTDGETIAREVVTPSNPNTDKQLYQRMIMATVMSAYAAGKEIFDHSFQGRKVGSECQQEFMQRNLLRLRAKMAEELRKVESGDLTADKCKVIVTGPKTRTPVPGNFIVSNGTYRQTFFAIKIDSAGGTLGIRPSVQNETVAAYASRCGLIPGDIYTLVAFSTDVEGDPVWIGLGTDGTPSMDAWDSQLPCYFQYWRLQVKADVLTNNAAFSYNAPGALAALFDLTTFNIIDDQSPLRLISPVASTFVCCDATAEQVAEGASNLQFDFNAGGSYGIIRSRYDEDLRSYTEMTTTYNYPGDDELTAGIASASALRQWRAGVETLGASSLILESNS